MNTRELPTQIGPYVVQELLGQGGMGLVYLANHHRTGKQVALKTVKAPTIRSLKTLQQEFRSLRRLKHPGVVSVLDDGVEHGVPWFAMELIKGRTLLEHLTVSAGKHAPTEVGVPGTDTSCLSESSWTLRLSDDELFVDHDLTPPSPDSTLVTSAFADTLNAHTQRLLGWMVQVCQALAYIHGEGVAHLDLKPDNILITEQGQAVLLDFGLALRLHHRISPELLENAGLFAGTVSYISPERVQGNALDTRADLYAVGCILYRIVAGRLPFVGTEPVEIARQHVVALPTPPSRFGVRLPEGLENLILGLLAKQPHKRPAHAMVVAWRLGRLGIKTTKPTEAPSMRTPLYRSGTLGREVPIGRLTQLLERANTGEGQAVALLGESGVGKSKLIGELIKQARQNGAWVIINRCHAPLAGQDSTLVGVPLHAFHGVFQTLVASCISNTNAIQDGLKEQLRLLLPYAPELKPFVIETVEPPQSAATARTQLFKALAQTIVQLAAQPLLLVLEDLQWADAMSLDALEVVLEHVPNAKCMVLCTCQSENTPPTVEALLDKHNVERLNIARLPHNTIATIIGRMMSTSNPPQQLLQAVVAAANGNPLFAVETLRLALDQGWLQLGLDGQWDATALPHKLPTPETVRELFDARLHALPHLAEQVVFAASVLGYEMDVDLLIELCPEIQPGPLHQALTTLKRRSVLEFDHGVLRFSHTKLHEVAYTRIEPQKRQKLHQRAATLLKARKRAEIPIDVAALAFHLEQTGLISEAVDAYFESANSNAKRFAYKDAERLYRRIIALTELPDKRAIRARREIATFIYFPQSRFADAEPLLQDVLVSTSLEEASNGTDDVRKEQTLARITFAQILFFTNRLEQADALLAQTRVLINAARDPTTAAHYFNSVGYIASMRRDEASMVKAWSRALAISKTSKEHDLKKQRWMAQGNIAWLHIDAGRCIQARTLLEEAISELGQESNPTYANQQNKASYHLNLVSIFYYTGELDDFDDNFSSALKFWEKSGDLFHMTVLFNTKGNVQRLRHRYNEAEQYLLKALKKSRQLTNPVFEVVVLASLGLLATEQGDLDKGLGYVQTALTLCKEHGDKLENLVAPYLCAHIHRRQGHTALACEILEAFQDRFLGQKFFYGQIEGLCEYGHVQLAQGGNAQEWLLRAKDTYAKTELGPKSQASLAILDLSNAMLARN